MRQFPPGVDEMRTSGPGADAHVGVAACNIGVDMGAIADTRDLDLPVPMFSHIGSCDRGLDLKPPHLVVSSDERKVHPGLLIRARRRRRRGRYVRVKPV